MSRLPWWFKIAAKIVLARLPMPAGFWRQVKLFRHGAMDDPDYALRIFRHHFARAGNPEPGWTCLELGPGDSLLTALIAKAYGAGRIWLVDAGDFASTEMDGFQRLAYTLKAEGLNVPALTPYMTVQDVLEVCDATYLTHGMESLKLVPRQGVDFVFSNAVLEHVRLHEFTETMSELQRVMKPFGVQSHAVDLKDHLEASLNNLRFSPALWENNFMARSGFYTNRLRHSEIMAVLQQLGYNIEETGSRSWPALPLPRTKMHRSFSHFTDADLCISDFEVILRN